MSEWILIIAVLISSEQGTIRDPSVEIIDGFTSKQACDAAGGSVAYSLIRSIGDARTAQGIPANMPDQSPHIQFNCVEIKKS